MKLTNSAWSRVNMNLYFPEGSEITVCFNKGDVYTIRGVVLAQKGYGEQPGWLLTGSTRELVAGDRLRITKLFASEPSFNCELISTTNAGDTHMAQNLYRGVVVKTKLKQSAEGCTDSKAVESVVYETDKSILAASEAGARDQLVARALEAKAITADDLSNQTEPVAFHIKAF